MGKLATHLNIFGFKSFFTYPKVYSLVRFNSSCFSFGQSPCIKSGDLCAYKCIVCSASTESLEGMLLGRFLVGIGMGIGPSVTALYVTEVLDI